jgi:hypothetical protein
MALLTPSDTMEAEKIFSGMTRQAALEEIRRCL